MKVTITKAAKLAGVSRNTIYNDIEAGVLSYTSNARNKKLIDISELARVYENIESVQDEASQQKEMLPDVENRSQSSKSSSKQDISAQVLQERLKATERTLETFAQERERERLIFEKRVESLEKALERAQDGHNTLTKLLEDQRESRGDEWKSSMRALEQRLANQEKAAKEREEKEQKLLDENKRIKQAYMKQKQAFEAEQNKSLWKKLFG